MMDVVTTATRPLRKLGFLTIGLFDPADPAPGQEYTLRMIELGEQLGFDSAWLRHRHLQFGISSPVAIMAAASQRTERIELGTAVTPLGWENPLRLAEDLATVDLLAGGRVNPGVSVGPPMRWDDVRDALYPTTAEHEDLSYGRLERFMAAVRGDAVTGFAGREGFEDYSDRVQPHSPGLIDRVWYGAASQRSAQWAAQHEMHLLTSSVVGATDDTTDFATAQRALIDVYRADNPGGRVSQGLVVVPTDSATVAQREKYRQYAAARLPRVGIPQGPGRLLFAPDLVGTSEKIAQQLRDHAGYQAVDEVVFALPFSFEPADYDQILRDIAQHLGPELGWTPTA